MKYLLIGALLLAPLSTQADPCLHYPKGKAPLHPTIPLCEDIPRLDLQLIAEGNRVRAVAKTLSVPADWHLIVINEAQWKSYTAGNGLHSNSAISSLSGKTTFVRESYVMHATDAELRSSIAHEMGHRECGCADEHRADAIQDRILRSNL